MVHPSKNGSKGMFPHSFTHWGVGNPAAPRGPNPNVRPK